MSSSTPLIAAAFLTPALFYGGAGAVSAPILIHLLARRRFKRIRWAAMDFLIDAQRRNRRRVRMEEWVLLALRCLAVLLIALMVARPFIKPAGAQAFFGVSQRIERVFVLDDSLSMAYQLPDGTPFSRAKLAVKRLLQSIRDQTPDDTVTLLKMTTPTAPITSGAYLDEAQTQELLSRLDAMKPSQRTMDPPRVIEGLVDVLQRNSETTSAAIYLISDFRRGDWVDHAVNHAKPERASGPSPGSPGSADSGLLFPLTAWATPNRGLHLMLIDVGVDDAANLAVTKLSLTGGRLVAGATGTVRAGVANFSRRSIENLELQVSVGHLDQPSKILPELAAHQSTTVDLPVDFFRAGFESVRLELPPDALPADNTRYLAADVAGAVRVLIVDGEPSADDYDDEVALLDTALRPEGELFSGNETVVVDETQLDEARLEQFHVVILANVYRISAPATEALQGFVRRGGGLIIFLGDQVDADLYNSTLYREGKGLLPARLTQIVRAAKAAHLVITDRLHPAMRGLSREGDPLGISHIPFLEYFACVLKSVTPAESSESTSPVSQPVPPEGTGGDTAPAQGVAGETITPVVKERVARVIARFDDADEHPAIMERPYGRGRVILLASTADKEWNHWADHPSYLPVMMELVRHVARRDDAGLETWVGEPIELHLDPAVFEPDAIVRTPAYPNEREIALTAAPAKDGRGLVLHWEHTNWAGLYQFLLKRREGGEAIRLVAANIDPSESDLTPVREDELRRTMGSVPFEYVKGIDQLAQAGGEARMELWRPLLLAVVVVLMMEQFLAWRWGRKR